MKIEKYFDKQLKENKKALPQKKLQQWWFDKNAALADSSWRDTDNDDSPFKGYGEWRDIPEGNL